jgi:phosphoglycolate phosphatase-like HAD superfamily hydrolase
MLILFDIDATLLTTTRAGIQAMGHAGRAMFGAGFDEHRVEYSGRLDPLIIRELLTYHGLPSDAEAMHRFREAYRQELTRLLADRSLASPCPGVLPLLAVLAETPGVTLGLLTGNFPETGAIKLRAAGIDPDGFPLAAWGCDSPHDPPARDHLPPVALQRYAAMFGRTIDPSRAVIIGDTPHDVSCARAHGLRSLAVATGVFSVDQLGATGADRVVPSLVDTTDILTWLIRRSERVA